MHEFERDQSCPDSTQVSLIHIPLQSQLLRLCQHTDVQEAYNFTTRQRISLVAAPSYYYFSLQIRWPVRLIASIPSRSNIKLQFHIICELCNGLQLYEVKTQSLRRPLFEELRLEQILGIMLL